MTDARSLILGIGNTLLGDDGVGCVVARHVHAALPAGTADLLEAAASGHQLVDLLLGYDRVVILDALRDPDAALGTVCQLSLEDLTAAVDPGDGTAHGAGLAAALAHAAALGAALPRHLAVFGVVVHDLDVLRESLSPELERLVPAITGDIKQGVCYLVQRSRVKRPRSARCCPRE